MNKVYLASPFFDDQQCDVLTKVEKILRKRGLIVFSPREHEVRDSNIGTLNWSLETFTNDVRGIDSSEFIVALYWGNYSDSGTAWEIGYAYATHKPVIIVQLGESSNLMIHEGSHTNLMGINELETYDFDAMPRKRYEGKMF